MSTTAVATTNQNDIRKPISGETPYILYYRQGSNPNPQFFVFYHESKDMRVVVDRIKRHCEICNLRFVNVKPLVVDLDAAELRLTGQSEG